MDLVEDIYRITRLLPHEEAFGLTNQLRRAAISIPSNIAEGNSRNTTGEYIRFLSIARGSKSEIETQLEICVRIGYLSNEQIKPALLLCIEISRMINTIIAKLSP